MNLQGGPDLSELEPCDPKLDGLGRPTRVGNHKGHLEALNVENAQPGFVYYYSRYRPSDVMRFLNRGWELVRAEDVEKWGGHLPDFSGTPLDGMRAFQDVVLVRAPEDIVGQERLEVAEQNRTAMLSAEQKLLSQNPNLQARLGRNTASDQGPFFINDREHGFHVQEE